ncbi:MAG TPA: FTR1 family protein [Rudaea sp.]|jgi:high-affinity iron transporter|nr:FTR1 family protein [Rudaea sp.]
MLGTGLLVFREVLEAALIVSIVCAATRGVPYRGRWVSFGIAAGVIGAILVAFFADAISQAVSGIGQELFNATVLLAAVVMIAWHAIWMSSHGRELATQMKSVGGDVQSGKRPLSALLIVVAIAVLREGSEIVLFLYGQAASGAGPLAIAGGIGIGVLCGVLVGFLLYFGLLGIPMRYFFSATNWLMLLLAAGLASQAAGFLIQADVLPAFGNRVWDSSALLSNGSLIGKTLHTLIGYDAQPAGMQLLFYAVTAVAIAVGMKVWGGKVSSSRVARARVHAS